MAIERTQTSSPWRRADMACSGRFISTPRQTLPNPSLWPSCQTEALSEMVPFHGASRGPILVNIRPFWSSIFQIRVVWEVSGGLRRRYCSKDRTYCYCSVQRFQCCSVVTVNTSNSVHPLTLGNPNARHNGVWYVVQLAGTIEQGVLEVRLLRARAAPHPFLLAMLSKSDKMPAPE